MRRKYVIWNVDRAFPVGHKRVKRLANAVADALELRSGEHHAVVPS